MIRNYFKVALRNIRNHKGYAAINMIGLATGLATCLLILLYVTDELSFDRFNEKADRIYRIHNDIRMGGGNLHLAVASDPMGATLKKDYPQVEEYTRIYNSDGSKLVKKGNQFIKETDVAHVDSTFFRVFTFPALSGDTRTALDAPNTVVITASAAKKYFETTDALGKMLEADKTPYKVTAVIRDMPHNAHFHFSMLFSMKNVHYQFGNFLSNNFQTYLLLRPGTDYKLFEKNFEQVMEKYLLPQAKQYMQISSLEDFRKAGNRIEYSLMPLTDIHLRSDRFPELGTNGNIQYVYIFSFVALFVLLIACVNFINLSTARSANRAKEVGIRKVLGTRQQTLITQFLVESTVTALLSMCMAIVITWVMLPYFNDLAAKSLSMRDLLNIRILPWLVALPPAVGIIAGLYPAFNLSSFQPINVLKGNSNSIFRKSNLRNALVVFQFAASIMLITATIIIYRQLDYIRNTRVGFNKEQVLIVNDAYALHKSATIFRDEISKLPGIAGATLSGFLPVSSSARNDNSFSTAPVMDPRNSLNMQRWTVDYHYIQTLGMKMAAGRNFSPSFGSDSTAMVINETTVNLLGLKDPVGKKLFTADDNNQPISYTIIGVVKNFNFESLRQQIGPLCMILGNSSGSAIFRVQTGHLQEVIAKIEQRWKQMAPAMPFSYRFLDDAFDSMYRDEQRIGKVAISFAILAIVIACMGLFGLATYIAEQRTREVGIRKVLGASAGSLARLLSVDFIKLVILSIIIATPVAWWAMTKWLQDFAYRAPVSWWIFAVAGVSAIIIALATVSFQAIRAALANPVRALRTE